MNSMKGFQKFKFIYLVSLLWALNSHFHIHKGRIFWGDTKKGFLYIVQSE